MAKFKPPRVGNWNLTSAFLYGRIPQQHAGTRVSMNGTTTTSTQLNPGFYTVYGVKSSSIGLSVFVADGTSSITASTKSYMIPANQCYDMEVTEGVNDYVAGLTYTGRVGTLCIYKM